MPCRCCGASRPSKGFTDPGEKEINDLLKQAAKLILAKDDPLMYENIDDWKKAWQEAFDHHLNGCKEKNKWIKIEDQLPELNVTVLCYALVGYKYSFQKFDDREKRIITLYLEDDYGEKKWRAECGCSGYEFDREHFDVIYWQPLPDNSEK